MKKPAPVVILSTAALVLQACGDPEEAPQVDLSVVTDASGITPVTTDLGYHVELTEARVMVENITFMTAGEAHTASLWRSLSDFVIPDAHAHPGHFQDGDVTGELRGRFVLNWLSSADHHLGVATLLVGSYKSANFTFALAGANDGVSSDDPLFGHTALFRGIATKGAESVGFVVIFDSPVGRELVGAPFELEIRETTQESLGMRLVTQDPLEGDTLFDGLDFAALEQSGEGLLTIDASSANEAIVNAYNLARRTFQTHDHFDVKAAVRAE